MERAAGSGLRLCLVVETRLPSSLRDKKSIPLEPQVTGDDRHLNRGARKYSHYGLLQDQTSHSSLTHNAKTGSKDQNDALYTVPQVALTVRRLALLSVI